MMYKEADLNKIKTISINDRKSKVTPKDFAGVFKKEGSFNDFMNSLPKILKAEDIKAVADSIIKAKSKDQPVFWMMGAHVIKCGLSPVVIDMMEKGLISTVSMNGAGAIHDLELACFGHTSEDVAENLLNGTFGMSKETAETLNGALAKGREEGMGFGEAVGRRLSEADVPNKDTSIFAAGYRLQIPVTVHVGIGTEIVHQHPSSDGSTIGELSMRDFRILADRLCSLGEGGVVMNVGSAVILPEVFLKALTVARNLGNPTAGFISVNLDMMQHYRPTQNVVSRPTLGGGKGYQITGHHEIMIPLLAAIINDGLG
ncbi:MAG: hypothetical protein GY863_05370 [bacterium]|nr:hypothetical protein [bacterium]